MHTLPMTPHTVKLVDGVTAHLMHAPHLKQAHFSIAMAVGYLDEPDLYPGLAHLLEHLLMTTPLAALDNQALLGYLQRMQGSVNANTDDRVTDFHGSVPTAQLETALRALGMQLARPHITTENIASEVAAIDAEFTSRQDSTEMRRLSALSVLARPTHIAASCRHGSAATLNASPTALSEELTEFHQRCYCRPGLTIGLLSALSLKEMQHLANDIAALFSPSSATPIKSPSQRWSTRCQVTLTSTKPATELLWPLETISSAIWQALASFSNTLNQGALIDALPLGVNDYHAQLAPSGAGDTLSLMLHGAILDEEACRSLSATLTARWQHFLASTERDDIDWRTNATLALPWWRWIRQQVNAARCRSAAPGKTNNVFCTSHLRCLRYYPPSPDTVAEAPRLVTPPASVCVWEGSYGVEEDFTEFHHSSWAVCYIPNARLELPPLARQHLAKRELLLHQGSSTQGSWLMVYGAHDSAPALCQLLSEAQLAPMGVGQGMLAQQLVQTIQIAPDYPALWVSHAEQLPAVERAFQRLNRQAPTPLKPPYRKTMPVYNGGELAVMRLLRLPTTPAARYLAALAERQQAGDFLHQIRHQKRLGYIAAIRRHDGFPNVALGYVVQSNSCGGETLARDLKWATEALWKATFEQLVEAPPLLPDRRPETPLAALETQWQQLLAGGTTPLHRMITTIAPIAAELDALHAHMHRKNAWQLRYLTADVGNDA